MFINLARGIYLTEEEFEVELAERRDKLGLKRGDLVAGCPLCGLFDDETPATSGNNDN